MFVFLKSMNAENVLPAFGRVLLIPWVCVSLAFQEPNISKCHHQRKITYLTKQFQSPAALRKACAYQRQIQFSFRTKQHLSTEGVASVVTCLYRIFTEHNTALTSLSCSGHHRTPLDKAVSFCKSLPIPIHRQGAVEKRSWT